MLRILYNFIEKTFACDSQISGVVSRINKRENPVFKLFVNFSCLENFRLYGICFFQNVNTYVPIPMYVYIASYVSD